MKICSTSFYGKPVKPISKEAKVIVSAYPKIYDTFIKTNNSVPRGFLDEFDIKNINEIKELFEQAHSSIKAIAKSNNTRTATKNGYSKLKKGVAGSRILEFSKIGSKGEDISINVRIDHGKTKKTIIIIDGKQYVINPKGEIEKNPSMRFVRETNVRQRGDKVEYYTQEEIDNSGLDYYMNIILQRLEDINSKLREGITSRLNK